MHLKKKCMKGMPFNQCSIYWGGGGGEDSPTNSLALPPKIANELLILEPGCTKNNSVSYWLARTSLA